MTDLINPLMANELAGQPILVWLLFLSFIIGLLALDLGVANKGSKIVPPKKAAIMWASFVALSLAFAGWIGFFYHPDPTFYPMEGNLNQQAVIQYLTGYALETALAFDNIFVISMVFAALSIPPAYQHRVLFWGILGAIGFRAIFIGLGASIVTSFTWVLYIFAAFLIFTGLKMLKGPDDGHDMTNHPILAFVRKLIPMSPKIEGPNNKDGAFFVRAKDETSGKWRTLATPLFLALVMVELVDIIFAVDSVPAIFAVTQDPFIVYSSNIFAILGLRSLYFLLADAADRFKYLKTGLALVLVLIGGKIIWNFGLAKGLHIVPYLEPHWSLLATVTIIGVAIGLSWVKSAPKST